MSAKSTFCNAAAAVFLLSPGICNSQWYQGPSGGTGGRAFDHWTESQNGRDIASVWVAAGAPVKCFTVSYRDRAPSSGTPLRLRAGNCKRTAEEEFKGSAAQITMEPDEYILGIAGRHGSVIDSMTVYTNKRTSVLLGGAGGIATFGYTAPSGQMIVGFFGRAGDHLDAIGVLYAPCTPEKRPCK